MVSKQSESIHGDKKFCGALKVFISADYPYINYYVINKSREEAGHFYTHNKLASHDGLNAAKLGYTLVHSMDLYDEVSLGLSSGLWPLLKSECFRWRRLPGLPWTRATRGRPRTTPATSSVSTRSSRATTGRSLNGTGYTGQVTGTD